MKKAVIFFSVVMITFLVTISSCKKNEDNNDSVPAEKKKYAWVSGEVDSTGYGMILFTPDAGETWVRQGQGSAALQGNNVMDIWAVDENNVWACGSDNTILRTINGGQTWTLVQAPVNIANTVLLSIFIVNKTNIWISGDNGTIYNSTDDGSTWTMLDTTLFPNMEIQGIWAISPEKIYVTGWNGGTSRAFIGYTLDGGTTWDSVVPANDYNKNEWISVTASGNTIIVYGGESHYVVSTDGGTTWKNDSVPGTGGMDAADINHLIMLNSQTWWGAFDLGNIFITTDGGTTWTEQPSPSTVKNCFLVGIDNWDSQLALIVSYSAYPQPKAPIIKTDNGGVLWENKFTCNSNLCKVTFIKD